MEIVLKEESYRVMGACFEVYREKGCGFLEAVYQECLEIEFKRVGVGLPAIVQSQLVQYYKGVMLKTRYVPDFVCFDRLILEIKAASKLTDEHRAQVHNYLRATGHRLGLLVNFGHFPKLESERIVH